MRRMTAFFWTNAAILIALSAIAYAPVGVGWSLAATGVGTLGLVLLWLLVRNLELPATTLLAMQAALVLHYVGLVPLDESRVYALSLGPLRYDKIVHAGASFAGVFFAASALRHYGARVGKMLPVVLLLLVLGGGAIVENIEYIAVESYGPRWDAWLANETLYDNDMIDLLANLAGALLGIGALWLTGVFRTPLALPLTRPALLPATRQYASSRGRGA